jgi:hypothetical protein
MYGDDLVESPPFHYDIIRSVAEFVYNIWACPRGSAKSTLVDEVALLLSLSRPGFPSGLILPTDSLVEGRMATLMWVLSNGEEIINDFGEVKPKKGGSGGIWNLHHLRLTNDSHILASSIESKKRGMKPRPLWLALDDPEFDGKESTDNKVLQREFENQLFRVLLPMGQKNVRITWTGTMINKQTSLYNACQGLDPRFRNWNRQILSATYTDSEGKEKAIWEAHMGLEFLQERKDAIGASNFASEYLNRPGMGEESTFKIDPDYCTFWEDDDFISNPYSDKVKIKYKTQEKGTKKEIIHEMTGKEFMDTLVVMSFTDYAGTQSATSDFSTVVTLGFQKGTDILFVLDAWQGKVKDEILINKILDVGLLWHQRIVGIEAVSLQKRFYELAAAFFEERQDKLGGWKPMMFPIRYRGNISKQSRIAGIQWRFNSHKIKLPSCRKHLKGVRELFYQIEEFNAEARGGNLQHDDLIDSVAMYQEVTRSRGVHQLIEPDVDKTPLQRLIAGELFNPDTGILNISAIRVEDLGREALDKIRNNWYDLVDANERASLSGRLDVSSHYRR